VHRHTESGVSAAMAPGSAAAPPAPAMITLSPRSRAPAANSHMRCGVRWAETMRTSLAMPRLSSASTAWRMVSQSD
jgi:hypothetical protein